LSRFGEIEKVWYSTPTEGEIFRLPEGIWVMYKLFQPSRDAQAVGAMTPFLQASLTSLRVFAITHIIDSSSHQQLTIFVLLFVADNSSLSLHCGHDKAQAVYCLPQ